MSGFRYGTRDWFWFSLVLCLAIGWGGHFRYSWWLRRNVLSQRPVIQNEEELRKMLSDAVDENTKLSMDASAHAIRETLTKEQRDMLEKRKSNIGKICESLVRPTNPYYAFTLYQIQFKERICSPDSFVSFSRL